MTTIKTTEAIPGMDCIKGADGKYTCSVEDSSAASLVQGIHLGLNYGSFFNSLVFLLIMPVFLVAVLYRLYFSFKGSEKGKKFLKITSIIFGISTLIVIVKFGLSLVAPWIYR